MNPTESRPDALTGHPDGIPVPTHQTSVFSLPSPYVGAGRFCGSCGETGRHLPTCQSLQRDSEAAALGIALARIRELEAQVAELEQQLAEARTTARIPTKEEIARAWAEARK